MRNVNKQQLEQIRNISIISKDSAKIARKIVQFVNSCKNGLHQQFTENWEVEICPNGILIISEKCYINTVGYITVNLQNKFEHCFTIHRYCNIKYSTVYEDFMHAMNMHIFGE